MVFLQLLSHSQEDFLKGSNTDTVLHILQLSLFVIDLIEHSREIFDRVHRKL